MAHLALEHALSLAGLGGPSARSAGCPSERSLRDGVQGAPAAKHSCEPLFSTVVELTRSASCALCANDDETNSLVQIRLWGLPENVSWLWMRLWAERKRCACCADLSRCIYHCRRRVVWCDTITQRSPGETACKAG